MITALFFGLSLLSPSIAVSSKTDTQIFQNIIIFRFCPDGNVKTTETDIEITNKSNVLEAVRTKCNALYENDRELQQFINKKENLYLKIESQGHGFHFAFFRPLKQSKLMLRSAIFYRYFNDEDYTKVNNLTMALGPHKGRVLFFVGYVCFSDRFFGSTAISGYSIFRIDIKPVF